MQIFSSGYSLLYKSFSGGRYVLLPLCIMFLAAMHNYTSAASYFKRFVLSIINNTLVYSFYTWHSQVLKFHHSPAAWLNGLVLGRRAALITRLTSCFIRIYILVMQGMYGNKKSEVHGLKRGLRPPFQIRSPSNLGLSSNSGLESHPFQPPNIILWSPETKLMVIWMRDTFEFGQPCKQAESKIK